MGDEFGNGNRVGELAAAGRGVNPSLPWRIDIVLLALLAGSVTGILVPHFLVRCPFFPYLPSMQMFLEPCTETLPLLTHEALLRILLAVFLFFDPASLSALLLSTVLSATSVFLLLSPAEYLRFLNSDAFSILSFSLIVEAKTNPSAAWNILAILVLCHAFLRVLCVTIAAEVEACGGRANRASLLVASGALALFSSVFSLNTQIGSAAEKKSGFEALFLFFQLVSLFTGGILAALMTVINDEQITVSAGHIKSVMGLVLVDIAVSFAHI